MWRRGYWPNLVSRFKAGGLTLPLLTLNSVFGQPQVFPAFSLVRALF
jgi:hypothetical protein